MILSLTTCLSSGAAKRFLNFRSIYEIANLFIQKHGYRPIRTLSYAIDYRFSGTGPISYHVSNIIYHALTALLVYLVTLSLIPQKTTALVAALIFAVHPVHTDSVAYLSGRRDILFTLFYLAGFLLHKVPEAEPVDIFAAGLVLLPPEYRLQGNGGYAAHRVFDVRCLQSIASNRHRFNGLCMKQVLPLSTRSAGTNIFTASFPCARFVSVCIKYSFTPHLTRRAIMAAAWGSPFLPWERFSFTTLSCCSARQACSGLLL